MNETGGIFFGRKNNTPYRRPQQSTEPPRNMNFRNAIAPNGTFRFAEKAGKDWAQLKSNLTQNIGFDKDQHAQPTVEDQLLQDDIQAFQTEEIDMKRLY